MVHAIAQGDSIEAIEILDDTTDLFALQASRIADWNGLLDR